MNSVGFIQLPSDIDWQVIAPTVWDHQTLVILGNSATLDVTKASIRDKHRPMSHSYGYGYEIDVYTNLDYDEHEKDPAMRNIRVVYCDVDNILTRRSINARFPFAYIIEVKGENRKDGIRFEP